MRFIGVHEEPTTGGRTVERAALDFPNTNMSRAFVPNLVTRDFVAKVEAALKPHRFTNGPDSRIYLSLKTDQQITARGGYRKPYQSIADYLCEEGLCERVYIIPWHEPEDNFTGTVYSDYFTNVRTAIKGKCSAIKVGTASNSYHWGFHWKNKNVSVAGKTDRPDEWRVETDFKGLDIYSGRTYKLELILPELEAFNRWHTLYADEGEFVINERGFATPSKTAPEVQYELRAETITREFDWLKNDPTGQLCTAYQYWNSSGREKDEGLVLDPLGEEALRAGILSLSDDTILD